MKKKIFIVTITTDKNTISVAYSSQKIAEEKALYIFKTILNNQKDKYFISGCDEYNGRNYFTRADMLLLEKLDGIDTIIKDNKESKITLNCCGKPLHGEMWNNYITIMHGFKYEFNSWEGFGEIECNERSHKLNITISAINLIE